MGKIKIIPVIQTFEVTDDDHCITIQNIGGIYTLKTRSNDGKFMFTGYEIPEDFENADAVIKLFARAIKFIKEEMKK